MWSIVVLAALAGAGVGAALPAGLGRAERLLATGMIVSAALTAVSLVVGLAGGWSVPELGAAVALAAGVTVLTTRRRLAAGARAVRDWVVRASATPVHPARLVTWLRARPVRIPVAAGRCWWLRPTRGRGCWPWRCRPTGSTPCGTASRRPPHDTGTAGSVTSR